MTEAYLKERTIKETLTEKIQNNGFSGSQNNPGGFQPGSQAFNSHGTENDSRIQGRQENGGESKLTYG